MSRGPGRVQRAILEALDGGPVEVAALAVIAQADACSVRRALRALARSGRVACLGYGVRGGQRWGLPGDVEDARAFWADVWPPDRQVVTAQVMGARFMRSLRRSLVSVL